MARQQRQPFSPTGEYVARRDFRFAGKAYKAGQPFPWRKLSCSTRRLVQLWEGRFIEIAGTPLPFGEVDEREVETQVEEQGVEDNESETESEETEEPEEEASEDDESEDEDSEGVELSDTFTFDPEIHRVVKSKKKGLVIKQGKKVLLSIDKKLAKKLRDADEPVEIDLG